MSALRGFLLIAAIVAALAGPSLISAYTGLAQASERCR